jgi:pyruvate ferredoxin oxidoreductase beta subunit
VNAPDRTFPYPGISAVADGGATVVWVETHVTQGACAYPITPSTNMGVDYALPGARGRTRFSRTRRPWPWESVCVGTNWGGSKKRLWVIGGDGALYDIGFQSLSRLLASGLDVKVLVLDTQVYSNTGGQTSTASFTSQSSRMSPAGKASAGKSEARKELAQIAIRHPEVFVAQTTCAHANHFYRAVLAANSYPGPAVVNVYSTCQPEHGVGDDRAAIEAKLAVDGRAFPLLVHDPRLGPRLRDRLSLQGNPNPSGDWTLDPKSGQPFTFIDFARGQGRFARNFDAEGRPTDAVRAAEAEQLENWHRLQELAGLR